MTDPVFQRVFVRLCSYLAEAGIEMTQPHCRNLLRLMDDVLAEVGEGDDAEELSETLWLCRAMDRLTDYFTLSEDRLPAPTPPLLRGSIGYPSHGG
ncbi:hypothetical protein [Marinobacter sp. F3R08]|uniref:hypothetical protein n=1 Tax=Marinobacter sp. F3R08 TaxID=2841559 RepID=UPI001C09AB8D|nr:hypothetical protein [Marinobacter sp. F3R08]MBU2955583.1 hypothetical protein [Marinobacter sp. F3R08]